MAVALSMGPKLNATAGPLRFKSPDRTELYSRNGSGIGYGVFIGAGAGLE